MNVVSHGSAAGVTVGGQLYDLGGTVSGATILSGGLLEVVSMGGLLRTSVLAP